MKLTELNDYRKVLGLQWLLITNKIVFKLLPVYEFAHVFKPTKQNVLKTIGMCYDL